VTTIAEDLRSLERPLTDLEEDPANARVHDDRSVAAIARSLERHGQRKPIVATPVDGRLRIVAGNGTLRAARLLGWDRLAVTVYADVTAAVVRAYALEDNRSAELARWSDPALAESLASIDEHVRVDLGWDESEVTELLRSMSEEPSEIGTAAATPAAGSDPGVPDTLPATCRAACGDVWRLGRHRLVCGDAFDPVVRARACPRGHQVVHLDPPFQLDYRRIRDLLIDPALVWVSTVRQAFDVIPRSWLRFERVLVKRAGHRSAQMKLVNDHSLLLQVGTAKTHPSSLRGTAPRSVIHQEVDRWRDHGKPVTALVENLTHWTPPWETLFDPFCGSGSALLAAERMGRACGAIELEPAWCEVVLQRWEVVTGRRAEREASEPHG